MIYKIDFINPSKDDNPKWQDIPGFRGQDQLCVYTFSYKNKTIDNYTGTNPWGMEAAVNSLGYVIEIADRVKIPNDGFVVSGNGKAMEFIKENVYVGSKIELFEKNLVLTNDFNHIKKCELNYNYKLLKDKYEKAVKNYEIFDLEVVKNGIKEIEFLMTQDEVEYQKIKEKIEVFLNNLSSSPTIASTNVWARPQSKSLAEIEARLDSLAYAKITGIYLECFYNGSVPYPSKITDYSSEVKDGEYGIYGNDYLKAVISEAHKRNIEVHAWVENFFVGENKKDWKSWYDDSWHMVNYDGSTFQGPGDGNAELVENGFIFLDPANPECHAYILSIYEEMLSRYNFDGIHIDYIRYPHGNYKLETSNGYTKYAINEFMNKEKLTGDIRELVKNDEIYLKWQDYRISKINQLVKEIRDLVKKINKNVFISMAVVDDILYAKKNKMQDWVPWVNEGLIDFIFPMAYYIGESEVKKSTKNLVRVASDNAFSYTGIMPIQTGTNTATIRKQIDALYESGALGYGIFQINNVLESKENLDYLHNYSNRNILASPHDKIERIIEAIKQDLNLKSKLYSLNLNAILIQFDGLKKMEGGNKILLLKKILEELKVYGMLNDFEYWSQILNIHLKKNLH